jgi:hypothetical protein
VALLDEVRTHLLAQGSTASGYPIYLGFLPASTGRAIIVTETAPANLMQHQDASLDNVAFQVVVRGAINGYSTARAKGEAIRVALESIGNESMGGRRYTHILLASGPIPLGQDELNQPRLSWNYIGLRSKTT